MTPVAVREGAGVRPRATSTSPGSKVERPLATVVIGGRFTSTLLTMILLPVVYQRLEERWPEWAASFHHQARRRHKEPVRASCGVCGIVMMAEATSRKRLPTGAEFALLAAVLFGVSMSTFTGPGFTNTRTTRISTTVPHRVDEAKSSRS